MVLFKVHNRFSKNGHCSLGSVSIRTHFVSSIQSRSNYFARFAILYFSDTRQCQIAENHRFIQPIFQYCSASFLFGQRTSSFQLRSDLVRECIHSSIHQCVVLATSKTCQYPLTSLELVLEFRDGIFGAFRNDVCFDRPMH